MPKATANKQYTGEFKQKVVEIIREEHLGYSEAARQIEVMTHERVASWERIYLTQGLEGLYVEQMGHGSMGWPRYPEFVSGKLNVSELARVCELSRPTVYKYLKLLG